MKNTISLDISEPIWNRFFWLAPLVLIGTTDTHGQTDFAPKHMVSPMGWDNYFGFVCTPKHTTYQNIQEKEEFTVTYVRPSQLLLSSLAASPRCEDDQNKSILSIFETVDASQIDAQFLQDGYVFLECKLYKTIDGFGENSLITGTIVAAHIHHDALITSEQGDAELIRQAPLLAYISPHRFSTISESNVFPFPNHMKK